MASHEADILRDAAARAHNYPHAEADRQLLLALIRQLVKTDRYGTDVIEHCFCELQKLSVSLKGAGECVCSVLSVVEDWEAFLEGRSVKQWLVAFRFLRRLAQHRPECVFTTLGESLPSVLKLALTSEMETVIKEGVQLATAMLCLQGGVEISDGHRIFWFPSHKRRHTLPQTQVDGIVKRIFSAEDAPKLIPHLCRQYGPLRLAASHFRDGLRLRAAVDGPVSEDWMTEQAVLRCLFVMLHFDVYKSVRPSLLQELKDAQLMYILVDLAQKTVESPNASRLRCLQQAFFECLLADSQFAESRLKDAARCAQQEASDASSEQLYHTLNIWTYASLADDDYKREMMEWIVTDSIIERLMRHLSECQLVKGYSDSFCLYWRIATYAFHSLLSLQTKSTQTEVTFGRFSQFQRQLSDTGFLKLARWQAVKVMEYLLKMPFPDLREAEERPPRDLDPLLSLLQCLKDILYFLSCALHGSPETALELEEEGWMETVLELLQTGIEKLICYPHTDCRIHCARVFVELLCGVSQLMYHRCQREVLPSDLTIVRSGSIKLLAEELGKVDRIAQIAVPDQLPLVKHSLRVLLYLKVYAEEKLERDFPETTALFLETLKDSTEKQLALLATLKVVVSRSVQLADIKMLDDLDSAQKLRQMLI